SYSEARSCSADINVSGTNIPPYGPKWPRASGIISIVAMLKVRTSALNPPSQELRRDWRPTLTPTRPLARGDAVKGLELIQAGARGTNARGGCRSGEAVGRIPGV